MQWMRTEFLDWNVWMSLLTNQWNNFAYSNISEIKWNDVNGLGKCVSACAYDMTRFCYTSVCRRWQNKQYLKYGPAHRRRERPSMKSKERDVRLRHQVDLVLVNCVYCCGSNVQNSLNIRCTLCTLQLLIFLCVLHIPFVRMHLTEVRRRRKHFLCLSTSEFRYINQSEQQKHKKENNMEHLIDRNEKEN